MLNTFKYIPLPHIYLLSFYGSFIPPSFLPPLHLHPFTVRALSFTSFHHLLSRCEAPPTQTLPIPATNQTLPLVPAPRAVCLRLPPFPVTFCSPLCRLLTVPMFLWTPGGFSRHRSLHASVSLPLPPRVLLQIMALSGTWFLVWWLFAQGKEARAPSLPGSRAPWSLIPLLLGYAGVVQANPARVLNGRRDKNVVGSHPVSSHQVQHQKTKSQWVHWGTERLIPEDGLEITPPSRYIHPNRS